MRSTLIHIPHADPLWDIPIFGPGWLLAIVLLIGVALIGYRMYREGWKRDILADIPILLVFAAVVGWLAPLLEEPAASGPPVGIPIRAYGVMVLLGIGAGIVMSMRQARRMGVDPEAVFSLCFWLIAAGFVGARTFYVLQHWEQFAGPSVRETAVRIVNLTDGGLVVYGSFIGASAACVGYVLKRRLPLLAMADLLAPGLMIGLALGRIGCLMNGCCWGGVCDNSTLGITFPQGSPPFTDQLERGWLVGMRTHRDPVTDQMAVYQVTPNGLAAKRTEGRRRDYRCAASRPGAVSSDAQRSNGGRCGIFLASERRSADHVAIRPVTLSQRTCVSSPADQFDHGDADLPLLVDLLPIPPA